MHAKLATILFLSNILALSVASPMEQANENPDMNELNQTPALDKRAKTGQTCAGDYSGAKIGVLACADVTWRDFNSITVDLSVRDSKGDSNDVYGWFRVYGPDGYSIDLPRAKLRNSSGVGKTVWLHDLKWDQGVGKITGVRAKACVDDAGSDTCTDGKFIANPYA
ncbi:hypothetical protein KC318_g528 [Hortaea werneckii]|nr:hypothetical protein KC334_g572 [Hortaea werneckii]KAI7026917.1 hypothetical protein KC355_g492 [Hortaea werneckii]KAI7203252.1 hypothetical protein KC324_g1353 [Hortaea werneckii]KAI7594032.1 hypothetical protein KC316_g1384 [Hortaea werneckii]KAI7676038.1 hypothetical protein KC318_g528 [Hortaea werneckii]